MGQRARGFSLVEMLVVLAVMAILFALAAPNLFGLRRQLTLEQAAQNISQGIQRCRTEAMAKSVPWRFVVTGMHSWQLQADQGNTWRVMKTETLPSQYTLTNVQVNDSIVFSTRGFGTFHLSGPVSGELRVTDGNRTLRIIPTMVGDTRVVQL